MAQTGTETQGTTNEGTASGGTTGTAADDESASYDEFQSCLESAAGGTTGFATEDEIRERFKEAGDTGAATTIIMFRKKTETMRKKTQTTSLTQD